MAFFEIFLLGFASIMLMMTILWVVSIFIKNVSIVDAFWGMGFIFAAITYYLTTEGHGARKELVVFITPHIIQ